MVDEEKDKLILIHYPMSLDLRWSEFNEDKPIGFMSKLKNYMPEGYVLRTRKGIEALTFTPQITDEPWDPINTPSFSADGETARCNAIFTFTSQATIGTNSIDSLVYYSAGFSVPYTGMCTIATAQSKYGGSSLLQTIDTAIASAARGSANQYYGLRSQGGSLGYWFMPGENITETLNNFLLTYWIYPLKANVSANAEWHFCFGNRNDGMQSFYSRHFDTNIQASYYSDIGLRTMSLGSIMLQDQWQFMAVYADMAQGHEGFYHYDPILDVETQTATTGLNIRPHFRTSSAVNTMGALVTWNPGAGTYVSDGSDQMSGYTDYVTMWDNLFTANSSNLTLIRAIRDLQDNW